MNLSKARDQRLRLKRWQSGAITTGDIKIDGGIRHTLRLQHYLAESQGRRVSPKDLTQIIQNVNARVTNLRRLLNAHITENSIAIEARNNTCGLIVSSQTLTFVFESEVKTVPVDCSELAQALEQERPYQSEHYFFGFDKRPRHKVPYPIAPADFLALLYLRGNQNVSDLVGVSGNELRAALSRLKSSE